MTQESRPLFQTSEDRDDDLPPPNGQPAPATPREGAPGRHQNRVGTRVPGLTALNRGEMGHPCPRP